LIEGYRLMTKSETRGVHEWPNLTRRQAEVLDLAGSGLSDDEIEARLNLSSRSLRFVFEKVFQELGVRDRAEAVTVWSGAKAPPIRRADRCPYHRPFPDGFGDCPAYRAMRVASLDFAGRFTGSFWTCQHLEARVEPETEGGWYAGCAIGHGVDRERWAAEVAGPSRLQAMNRLAAEMLRLTAPLVESLLELKRRQRRALERDQDGAPITGEMERVRNRFLTELDDLLRRERDALEPHRLSRAACLDVARRAIDGLLADKTGPGWNVRYDILLGLPHEAWLA
jgi:DNA-binding CsgD family transcriptional regulator